MKAKYFVLIFLISLSGFAQDKKIDSLKQIVNKRKPDSIAVMRMFDLSYAYFTKKDAKNAFGYADKAGSVARQIDNKLLYAQSFAMKGNIVMVLNGNFPASLHYAFEELKIYETLKDSVRLANSYSNISGCYDELGDIESSLKYIKKAHSYMKKSPDADKTYILNSLGYAYVQKKNPQLSLPYFQQANNIAMTLKNDDYSQLAFSLYGLGKSNWLLGNQGLSMAYFRKSIGQTKSNPAKFGGFWSEYVLQLSSSGLAEIYRSKKMNDSAMYYYQLSLTPKFAKNRLMLDAYRNMARLNETSDMAKSVRFYRDFVRLNDSLYNDKKTKEIQNLTFNEQERQREKAEKERLEQEERQHHLQYAGIAIIITIFIGLLIMLSHSLVIGEKWLKVLGIIGLLLTFEFINLLIHPYIGHLTHHSPVGMLLIMVAIAALLVPMHHKIEHWATHKMLAKNKQVKLEAARKILEKEQEIQNESLL